MLLPRNYCAQPGKNSVGTNGVRWREHGASSKEKAFWGIHPRSFERGILAFSRQGASRS